MLRKPFGVWISVALALFVLSLWVGNKAGVTSAALWHRIGPPPRGQLSAAEARHIEAELSDLELASLLVVPSLIRRESQTAGKPTLPMQPARVEEIRREVKTQEMRPVVDLRLGLAYLDEGIFFAQNNQAQLASSSFQSAQVIFQSLGWKDSSEQFLRSVAETELSRWTSPAPAGAK